ncbi:MAG: tetratricopeptide repeat protein [Planctomycetia bacterium]|nr:tetratricopeptide repeat protein [Planctomycetia bacterium]
MADKSILSGFAWNLAFTVAAIVGTSSQVRADLTVENLTGTAISGIGPYYQDVADAIRLFATKDFAAALSHLESAKKSTPRLPPSEIMMANLYLDANQSAPAIAHLEKAARQWPKDPESYVMLAERAVNEGRVTEAGLMFEKAVGVIDAFNDNPKRKQNLQIRAYLGWAAADEIRADWKEAQQKLEQLIKLDQRSATGHERLGRVLFRSGNDRGAYAEFQLAAEIDKKLLPAELAMATLYSDKVNREKWLNFGLKKSGQDPRTQLAAAEFLLLDNQIEEAKSHAEEALKLQPDSSDAQFIIGLASRMLGDYKAADSHLSAAHLRSPANPTIMNHLALSLIELPDDASHQRGLQFAELNLRQNPNNVDFMATLGWINFRLKNLYDAERLFTAVLNSSSVSATNTMTSEMGYYMASIAKERGKIPEAVKLLQDSLNTEQPFAYRKKAQELLAQLSKFEKSNVKPKTPVASGKAADAK